MSRIGTARDEPPSSELDEAGVPAALDDSGPFAGSEIGLTAFGAPFAPPVFPPPWPPLVTGVSGAPGCEPEGVPEGAGEPDGSPPVELGEVCEDPPLGAPTESPARGGVLLPVAVGGASVY